MSDFEKAKKVDRPATDAELGAFLAGETLPETKASHSLVMELNSFVCGWINQPYEGPRTISTGDSQVTIALASRSTEDPKIFSAVFTSGERQGTLYIYIGDLDPTKPVDPKRGCYLIQGNVSLTDLESLFTFNEDKKELRHFENEINRHLVNAVAEELLGVKLGDKIDLKQRLPEVAENLNKLVSSRFATFNDDELDRVRIGLMEILFDSYTAKHLPSFIRGLDHDLSTTGALNGSFTELEEPQSVVSGDLDEALVERLLINGLHDFTQQELRELLSNPISLVALSDQIFDQAFIHGNKAWQPCMERMERLGLEVTLQLEEKEVDIESIEPDWVGFLARQRDHGSDKD